MSASLNRIVPSIFEWLNNTNIDHKVIILLRPSQVIVTFVTVYHSIYLILFQELVTFVTVYHSICLILFQELVTFVTVYHSIYFILFCETALGLYWKAIFILLYRNNY